MVHQFAKLKTCPELIHTVTCARFDAIENFNLADHVGIGQNQAIQNRRTICDFLKIDFNRLTVAQQVHQVNVAVVTPQNAGQGHTGWKNGIPATDAMITNLPQTPLMVLSADCPLVLVYDKRQRALGLIHASWRCTFGGIVDRTIDAMATHFHSIPSELIAGIGPGAGPCCYKVDDPFVQTIQTRPELLDSVFKRGDQQYFNLWSAIKSELLRAGLTDDNIETMGKCTICDDTFFSFRRQGDKAGRFGLIAAIQNQSGG